MRKIAKYGCYTLFILLVVTLYSAVDLNSRLNRAISELVYIKSEDQLSKEHNRILRRDEILSINDNSEFQSEFQDEKPDENISFSGDESPFEENNIKCREAEEEPFVLAPKINFDYLQNRYGTQKNLSNQEIKGVDLRYLSVKDKKAKFIELILEAVKESRNKLLVTYNNLLEMKEDSNLSKVDKEYLSALYKLYRIKDHDFEELLLAVKPHPISVILAQAALESGWGTSRFFREGNNIFGIWSFDSDDDRIKAKNSHDVFLKKYDSYIEAVDDYMVMLGRTPQYEDFRKARLETDDPYELIQHLSIYSELREEYVNRLRLVIKANQFDQLDEPTTDEEDNLGE